MFFHDKMSLASASASRHGRLLTNLYTAVGSFILSIVFLLLLCIYDTNDMVEQFKNVIVGIIMAVLAYLKPIEGEMWSLFLIFFLNFAFGYLSGMIANGEDFSIKKAFRCIGEATVFFVLCASIYAVGRFKDNEAGALQCVSFITYVIIYFYATNILKNLKKTFRNGTTPWLVVSFLYYVLRFKFIERIPFLAEYMNLKNKDYDTDDNKQQRQAAHQGI